MSIYLQDIRYFRKVNGDNGGLIMHFYYYFSSRPNKNNLTPGVIQRHGNSHEALFHTIGDEKSQGQGTSRSQPIDFRIRRDLKSECFLDNLSQNLCGRTPQNADNQIQGRVVGHNLQGVLGDSGQVVHHFHSDWLSIVTVR